MSSMEKKPLPERDASDFTLAQEPGSASDQPATREYGPGDPIGGNKATERPPNPPPNGGTSAWFQVLGGFLLFFNTWGLLNTFGVFQTYYESGALFQASSSSISWIGSIQSFFVLFMGIVVGPIYDRGYLRALLVVGSTLIVLVLMMLSLCSQWWQVFMAQGLCIGIGAGCLFIPCVSIMPTYFSTKLGLAQGLSASGSAMGGVIYPIVLYQLLDRIGFPWTVRVLGFIALATLLVPIVVLRMRIRAAKPRAFFDVPSLTDVPYLIFTVATLIGWMSFTVAAFYVSYFGQARGIVDERMAFYLVPILNAASWFGRAMPAALSDKTGPFNIIAPCTLLFGIVLFCFQSVSTEPALIVLVVLAGFFSGVLIAMPPICFAALTKNKAVLGTRAGMGFCVSSFGMLAGGPGAGSILGAQNPLNWTGVWSFGGVGAVVAGILYIALRISRSGTRLFVKC
ncbi:MFS general substrate transporter [Thozetella sp. PMI_491]|nr:MFS general substrate transporter [Thozetella sp. PMI_491]